MKYVWILSLASCATTAAAPAPVQTVLVDLAYDHTAETTKDSHMHVKPPAGAPADWRSPVDFTAGHVRVRVEVLTKPSAEPTRFQVCFSGTPRYACTAQSPPYTGTGVVEWDTPFPKFYQYDKVDWSRGIKGLSLILKDTKNGKPAPENVGVERSALFLPTRLHVRVTLVPL